MSKVFFYQFESSRFEDIFVNYLQKIYPLGKIEVRLKNDESLKNLDNLIWRKSDISFLPHEIYSEQKNLSPIILTKEKIKRAVFKSLILLEGCSLELTEINDYERLAIFFEKNNIIQLEYSRKLWKELKLKDIKLKYYMQNQMKWIEVF